MNSLVDELAQKTILIVDDIKINVLLLRKFLEQLGVHKVLEAQSGREAIVQYLNNGPDLIFMDIEMGELSGLETTEIIRKIEQLSKSKHIPVISISGTHGLGFSKERDMAGMDGFIPKPFKMSELEACLRHWFCQKTEKLTN